MRKKGSGLAGSAAAMASGTLVSRILGLVRGVLLLAAISSVGGAANAFSVANKLPNIIYMLIAGGVLNAVLVPQIVRAMRRQDGGQTYVNRLLTLSGGALLAITALLTLGSTVLLTIYAGSIAPEWRPIALAFAYLCMPQLFFYGLYTLLGQVLNARGNFGPYMWAPVLNNVVAIAGLVTYLVIYGRYTSGSGIAVEHWTPDRILLFAGTATAGVTAQALILVIPLWRSGFRYRPDFHFRGVGLGQTSKVAMWAFAALAVGQVGYVAISNLAMAAGATEVAPGQPHLPGNGSYDTAFMIFMLPQSLITVSLVTAIFTRLSHHAAAGSAAKVRNDLSFGLRTLAVFTVFATSALMVLAIPAVTAITAGQISWDEQRWIGHIVAAFAAGLLAIGAWTMIQRVYYAYEDTRTLFHIQIPMMVIVVTGCGLAWWLLAPEWWVVGTAVATTLSNSFGALVAYLGLRRKLPSLDGSRVLRTHVRLVVAVIPATVIGWGLLYLWGPRASFIGAVARVAVIGLTMLIIYLLAVHRLQVSELAGLASRAGQILAPITRRLDPLLTRLTRLPGANLLRTIGIGPTRVHGSPPSQHERAADQGADTAVSQTPPSPGDIVAERYRLIGAEAGSYPPSWKAEDEILARTVRIVFLPSDHQKEALNAARRSALVTDPRLLRVQRVGVSEGEDGVARAYIVTEWFNGRRLDELLAAGPLPVDQARALIGEAAAALNAARRRGLHHLALAPTSIAVTDDGGIRVLGLGYTRACLGITSAESAADARIDATGLVQLLYAALTGTWPGTADRAGSVPVAEAGTPTPLSQAADVPRDLDTLCAATFGPHDQGPATAGELVKALAPWPEVTPGTTPGIHPGVVPAGVTSRPPAQDHDSILTEDPQTGEVAAVPTGAALEQWQPTAGPVTATVEDQPFDEIVTGTQASAQAATPARHAGAARAHPPAADRAPAAADEPTVPADGWDVPAGRPSSAPDAPATHPSSGPTGEDGVSSFGPAPSRRFETATRTQPAASTSQAGGSAHTDAGRRVPPPPSRPTRPWSRGNSGGLILLIMVAVVVFGIVLAVHALRSPFADRPDPAPVDPYPLTQEPTDSSDEGSEDPEALPSTTPSATPEGPITIDEAITFDPTASGGENQELAYYAYDGDTSTIWRSLRYNSPTYGMKAGLGFTVVLDHRSEVSEVVLDVHGTGGNVQVRAAPPDAPDEGPVLAEGPLDHETTFEFDKPVEADSIALWFNELPVADSDGRNRIELAGVQVR